ncbi:MAG: cation transporter [Bacilli bacterium]|nr:cation transporter [Bacilli bacterium]
MKADKKILIAFLLNLFFSIIEFIGGIITNSVAIISDSIHDIGDAISIGISYFLELKSNKKPDEKYTYGYVRYSLLGSIITNLILLIGSVFVVYNAIIRIFTPVLINYDGMVVFAIIGFVINFLAAYFTRDGKSLNQKAVNLHMLEDVLGWLVVLIGAIVMRFTNIVILDSILSILVALFILINALKSLKKILDIFLEKTPNNINLDEIKKELTKINGVLDVHHIHIRSIDGFYNYATMHIVVDGDYKKIKHEVKHILENYNINHVTIEFEEKNEKCDNTKCDIKKEKHAHHNH